MKWTQPILLIDLLIDEDQQNKSKYKINLGREIITEKYLDFFLNYIWEDEYASIIVLNVSRLRN